MVSLKQIYNYFKCKNLIEINKKPQKNFPRPYLYSFLLVIFLNFTLHNSSTLQNSPSTPSKPKSFSGNTAFSRLFSTLRYKDNSHLSPALLKESANSKIALGQYIAVFARLEK